jgi:hypothetical protein
MAPTHLSVIELVFDFLISTNFVIHYAWGHWGDHIMLFFLRME